MEVWVWSGARDNRARYLSNFTHGHEFTVQVGSGAMTFASIELAFHAHKMLHLVGGPRIDLAEKFSVKGEYGRLRNGAQKRVGGKVAFDALGVELDVLSWKAASGDVMKKLVEARAEADELYTSYARHFVHAGATIRHFARGKFYRCRKTNELMGRDDLGPLLMSIGSR